MKTPTHSVVRPGKSQDPESPRIDPRNEWVYFGPINGKGLCRIPASALADPGLSNARLAGLIEPYGEKRSSDGINVDDQGNVYVTDVENHAIGVANLSRK